MNYTTTTEISRKGSKIFSHYKEAVVMFNSKPIGAVLNYEVYEYIKNAGYIDKAIADIYEQDEKTEYLVGLQNSMKEWNNQEHDNLFA